MPSDRFTNVNVYFRRIDLEDGRVQAAVQLPSQSVIKEEILGDPKDNVKLAKQHAAFRSCIMLYEKGELNDNLVPVDSTQKVDMVENEYFEHWKFFENDTKKAGNRVNRRYHSIKSPNVLQNSGPKVHALNFLYRITVRPLFDAPDFPISDLKELIGNGNDFGILTSRRIPRLCKMRLFMSYGEIEVEISALPMTFSVDSEAQLKLLQNFHVTIFRDVLKTWMKSFVLDSTSYLVVPLDEDVKINWRLVEDFQCVEQPVEMTYDEIQQADFSHEAYYQRIINPVYRCDNEPIYCVMRVCTDMSPKSEFPDDNFESFKEYFEEKFPNTTVTRLDQPMIEVKGISKNMNLFFPGAGNKGKLRKHERPTATEFLIPSMCHNFKFPADYWLKALMLPSICHRMQYLLLAEELRNWLIDKGVDKGQSQQLYQLDVDYENYDERVQELEKVERDNEASGKNRNIVELIKKFREQQAMTSSGEARHTNALLLWDKSKLPIDIDRNWLNVTEVDIDYYCKFLNQNSFVENPSSLARLQEINGSPKRTDRFLTDVCNRSDIKLIHLNGYGVGVQQKDLIKVLTTSNAGDVFDMERYEVLGDGFLKFIVSLFLYKEYENWHEGYLTTLKGKLVSNRNLFYVGKIFGLAEMIKSHAFKATEMLPPSIRLPSKMFEILNTDKTLLTKLWGVESLTQEEILSGEIQPVVLESFVKDDDYDDGSHVDTSLLSYIQQHNVGDKIIADAVEALLGVVVQSVGIEAGLKLCQKLSILPQEKNLNCLLTDPIAPRLRNPNAHMDDSRIMNRENLEKTIGYKFKNSVFLTQALTHSSYPIKSFGSYEQLEFLGDAVLDFLVSSYIIEQCPDLDPGKLTDLRSALVNNVTLACIVVRNGIHKYLRFENVLLMEAIKKFVAYQTSKKHEIVLDQIILLKTEEDATTAESIDVPKVIGDVLESIVGAIFLDSGMSLETTWKVIYGLMKDEFQEFMVNVPYQIVRQLFEFEKGSAVPEFFQAEVLDEDTIGVPVQILCRGERKLYMGTGKNKKLAKKCAAKLALNDLLQR
jgi:endoribonuclease Dicer